jgi:hypothetical protein
MINWLPSECPSQDRRGFSAEVVVKDWSEAD